MSGYPHSNFPGNPQQYPPGNPLYPQIPNLANPPPPGMLHMTGGHNPYPAYPGYPGYQGYPGQAGQPVAAMSYPGLGSGMAPTPTYPSAPNQQPDWHSHPTILEWVATTPKGAPSLSNRAIVAGYEGHDNSPLWIIRTNFKGDMLPGKLAVKHHAAYVAWDGKEHNVHNIEVLCGLPEKVRWIASQDGCVPPNAVPGGYTASGETLYIGRAREQGSLTPGKVHQSHKVMYMSFSGKEIPHKTYEVLCLA